jgi:hypothetical protein
MDVMMLSGSKKGRMAQAVPSKSVVSNNGRYASAHRKKALSPFHADLQKKLAKHDHSLTKSIHVKGVRCPIVFTAVSKGLPVLGRHCR